MSHPLRFKRTLTALVLASSSIMLPAHAEMNSTQKTTQPPAIYYGPSSYAQLDLSTNPSRLLTASESSPISRFILNQKASTASYSASSHAWTLQSDDALTFTITLKELTKIQLILSAKSGTTLQQEGSCKLLVSVNKPNFMAILDVEITRESPEVFLSIPQESLNTDTNTIIVTAEPGEKSCLPYLVNMAAVISPQIYVQQHPPEPPEQSQYLGHRSASYSAPHE
ncbi:MAG: hypothetical protein ACI8WB_000996 [Phenylobacterium sp.]|jgi:hypothetical protein